MAFFPVQLIGDIVAYRRACVEEQEKCTYRDVRLERWYTPYERNWRQVWRLNNRSIQYWTNTRLSRFALTPCGADPSCMDIVRGSELGGLTI